MSKVIPAPSPLFDSFDHFDQVAQGPIFNASDYRYTKEFIFSYRGSQATFNAYRRELERFLHWSWLVQQRSIKELRRPDIEQYIEFCKKPPLTWIGTKNVARFVVREGQRIANLEWRPFVATISKIATNRGEQAENKNYQSSQKAIQACFATLSSFYNYLIEEDYVQFNPVAQIRQKSKYFRKQQSQTVIRRLSDLQWHYVVETAEKLAEQLPEQHERTLFIMSALYGMYLRISELAASSRWQPTMGDFHIDRDGNWWFRTVGKGNKERLITVSDEMLKALRRYRASLGLSQLPTAGETTPLISKTRGFGPITSTRQIRSIVQQCFDATIDRLKIDGFSDEAEQLAAATVHWLRHTGISDDVQHRPREHVRDDAGHGSSAITDKYIDVELRARHASAKKKRLKPDE